MSITTEIVRFSDAILMESGKKIAENVCGLLEFVQQSEHGVLVENSVCGCLTDCELSTLPRFAVLLTEHGSWTIFPQQANAQPMSQQAYYGDILKGRVRVGQFNCHPIEFLAIQKRTLAELKALPRIHFSSIKLSPRGERWLRAALHGKNKDGDVIHDLPGERLRAHFGEDVPPPAVAVENDECLCLFWDVDGDPVIIRLDEFSWEFN